MFWGLIPMFAEVTEEKLVGAGGGGGGVFWGPPPPPPPRPHYFLEEKFFFHVKSENIKVLHLINIWDFGLFIEQDMWQKVDSICWICRFSSKLSYHSHQQRLCKFLFLIWALVKANNDWMCGSL